MNPNDWLCPNPQCINATRGVFGKHPNCPKCGSGREPMAGMGGMGCMGGAVARGVARPGDWFCPNPSCINATRGVFAKNETCPKCGTEKEASTPIAAAGPPVPTRAPGLRPGDWLCPTLGCLNATKGVFARYD